MNRRKFLELLGGTAALSTTTIFLPPLGGWPQHKPWWHPEVLPSVLKEIREHHEELRGYGYVPLNANQWQSARKLVGEHERSSSADLHRMWQEDRMRRASMSNVVVLNLEGGNLPSIRTPMLPITAAEIAEQIDRRSTLKR